MPEQADREIPATNLSRLVDSISEYLKYQKEEGVYSIESAAPKSPVVPTPSVTRATVETPMPDKAGADTLQLINAEVRACKACPLCEGRTRAVPGQGSSNPEIMFIGEGPGADEDRQGLAFVGRAGQLLTRIIEAMGLTREDVFIGNIVKCRPPENRAPLPDEMEACMPYLKRQIALLKPKVIVCLGATAVKGLFDVKTGITKLRGTWMSFEDIDTMPTFHPAYLLRNASGKKDVWEDMKAVLDRLGREPPPRKK